jgi:regulator of sigma E protease
LDNHETRPEQPEVTPPQEATGPEAPAPEPTMGEWLRANLPTLLILGALFVFLYIKFDSDGLWAIAKAALGLGLVIFVHELGHFLVAKWCDVHVTVFSIGFGPAIPGCSFKWGETTYKLALFPLGGYVQMVGQVDGDESTDEGAVEDPRSYRNKSVGQRMAIISAGVIMNVILAVICFIVVFQGPGKDRKAAVPEAFDTGGPAWVEGIPSGVVITRIGNTESPYFEDLMVNVMATDTGEHILFAYEDPYTGAKRTLNIEPRLGPNDSKPMLGISPALTTQLELKRYFTKIYPSPAAFRSAASRADPPLEFGDRIIATTDPDKPSSAKLKKLAEDKRPGAGGQPDYFDLLKRMRRLAGQEITLLVERVGEGGKKTQKEIRIPPAYHLSLGARMGMGPITAVRKNSPAKGKVQVLDPDRAESGDVIVGVLVKEKNGDTVCFGTPAKGAKVKVLPLDPVRLPDQLRAWAGRTAPEEGEEDTRTVTLRVRGANRQNGGEDFKYREVPVAWDPAYEDNIEGPMTLDSPQSIPGLGIAYRIKNTVAGVEPPPADAAGRLPKDPISRSWLALSEALGTNALRKGDVIKKLRYSAVVNGKGDVEMGRWAELKKPQQWARVALEFQQPNITRVDLQVERDGKPVELTIYPWEVKDWPQERRGMLLATDKRCQKADGFVDAIGLGLKDTKNSMIQVFQNLRGMIVGRISVENLGGPITIGRVAYYFAGLDFWEFVFFLGLISVNLAVINFLPIPVLDGGHMVFLLYEKIRGKPASEGVRVGATYAGLLLLASLMIFVLFLDIKRLL